MTAEKVFPKVDGDVFYSSEANALRIVNLVAGENLTAGNVVYIKQSDGKVYVSDTGTADDIRASGIVLNSPLSTATAYVQLSGNYVTTGLTANEVYYLGATGAISTTRSGVQVGYATSTTNLFIEIIQDDKDAVGTVKSYLKSFTAIPSNNLTAFWKECDGSSLSDAESPLNGQTLPNLNAGTYRILRGAATSGGTGGGDTHSHQVSTATSAATGAGVCRGWDITSAPFFTDAGSTLPAYYEVVFIMKVK